MSNSDLVVLVEALDFLKDSFVIIQFYFTEMPDDYSKTVKKGIFNLWVFLSEETINNNLLDSQTPAGKRMKNQPHKGKK